MTMATRQTNDDIWMDRTSQGKGHRFVCICIDPMMLVFMASWATHSFKQSSIKLNKMNMYTCDILIY